MSKKLIQTLIFSNLFRLALNKADTY